MATIAIGMPVFAGNDDDDLERFFELYKGYIHSIGIDPSAVAGNPAGWEKAMGILRACLTGPAARWYDSNILGKRVKLRNILLRLAHGDEAAFKDGAANKQLRNNCDLRYCGTLRIFKPKYPQFRNPQLSAIPQIFRNSAKYRNSIAE